VFTALAARAVVTLGIMYAAGWAAQALVRADGRYHTSERMAQAKDAAETVVIFASGLAFVFVVGKILLQ
jgi:hypothetical protein